MRALPIFILTASLLSCVASGQICYDDLGCFVNNAPFSGTLQRPIAVLPETPEKIATKFNLFTKANSKNGVSMNYQSIPSQFNPSLKTVVVIHGFLDNVPKPWMFDIKNALLQVENVNVIIVDWTKGNQFPYTQATANTQVVGAEVARLINALISQKGAKAENFHLVGHSLGAHISGYAGAKIKNLGRITGLDPAGPYFEYTEPIVRLDPTDALYVDAIHTDGAGIFQIGFGLMQPVGHADFYPNGGKAQPDCKQTLNKLLAAVFNLVTFDMDEAENSLVCNHMAAISYFIESIHNNPCRYNLFKCGSKKSLDNRTCNSCHEMGYWSTPGREQGMLYLNTINSNKDAFCTESYKVKLLNTLFRHLFFRLSTHFNSIYSSATLPHLLFSFLLLI